MQLRRWKKKGMEAGFLVALIITIAGGLLVGGVVMRFMSSASDKEAENICHDSVALRARTGITADGDWKYSAEVKTVPALCKTIDKKIQGDREEIKEQFAYKIARCWWMFGEGRYEELLDSSKIQLLPSVFGFDRSKSKCFVCYNLMVDQDVIDGGPIPPWEMNEYMSNHKYPGSNVTYLQYIQSYGGPGKIVFGTPDISSGQAYGISMMPKNKAGASFWNSAGRILVGGIIVAGVICLAIPPCIAVLAAAVGLGGAGAVAVGSTTVIAGTATTVAGTTAALSTGGILIPLSAVTEVVAATTATAVAGTAASATAATAVSTLKVAAIATTVGGSGATIAASGVNNIWAAIFAERDFSLVSVLPSSLAEEKCGSGDIAGE